MAKTEKKMYVVVYDGRSDGYRVKKSLLALNEKHLTRIMTSSSYDNRKAFELKAIDPSVLAGMIVAHQEEEKRREIIEREDKIKKLTKEIRLVRENTPFGGN